MRASSEAAIDAALRGAAAKAEPGAVAVAGMEDVAAAEVEAEGVKLENVDKGAEDAMLLRGALLVGWEREEGPWRSVAGANENEP